MSHSKEVLDILVRYLILLAVAIQNLYLFYFIFTPLTIYPVYFLTKLFFQSLLSGNIITINSLSIQLIDACIAASAYYLLLILNLSTPKIRISRRIKMLFLAFISILILNVLRIFFLILLALNNSSFFEIIHKTLWYFLSIILVVGIWFIQVKIFKIKQIPFYSDFKHLFSLAKN